MRFVSIVASKTAPQTSPTLRNRIHLVIVFTSRCSYRLLNFTSLRLRCCMFEFAPSPPSPVRKIRYATLHCTCLISGLEPLRLPNLGTRAIAPARAPASHSPLACKPTRACACLIWGHARIAQPARMQADEGVCVGETPSHINTGQVALTAVDA
jgi:hypothetical protein